MKPLVIKVGGALLQDNNAIDQFFLGIGKIQQPVVMVHGGGVWLDQRFADLGLSVTKIAGKRVTPTEQVHQVVEVLSGIVNKRLLSAAVARGMRPVGLTLSEGQTLNLTPDLPELQAVARTKPGSDRLVRLLLKEQQLPIFACVGMNEQGQWFNVNADDAAVAVAQLLTADLALLSDVPGVLDANHRVIATLDALTIEGLLNQGIIAGGMRVKVLGALEAAQSLNTSVWIGSWKSPDTIASLCLGVNKSQQTQPPMATCVNP